MPPLFMIGPFGGVWTREEIVAAVIWVSVGVALVLLVYRLVRRMPWPRPFRLRFVLVHLVAAPASGLTWLALSGAIESLVTGWPEEDRGFMVVVGSFVYAVVAGISYASEATGRAARAEAAEAQAQLAALRAQLAALRMQLNPHFLFNALSAASALTKRDPSRARRVLVDLSELLRLALDTTEEEIPLRDELVFLDRYLRIEQDRMGGRLRVRIHADPDTLDALVPPLLLQPLVENAVKHGVAPLEEGGDVVLRVVRDRGDLVVTVRDTGRGLSAVASTGRGIGLENVRRRLDWLHGPAAALSIESPPGNGLTATVRLPLRTAHTARPPRPPVPST